MRSIVLVFSDAVAHFFMAVFDPSPLLCDLDGFYISIAEICLHKASQHFTGPWDDSFEVWLADVGMDSMNDSVINANAARLRSNLVFHSACSVQL